MEKFTFKVDKFDFDGVKPSLILETQFSKNICIAMQSGSCMKEHQAPGEITVQVLKGCIEFAVKDDVCTLNELEIIHLEPNVPHSLKALQDSIVRLTLSKDDSFNRVLKVKTTK